MSSCFQMPTKLSTERLLLDILTPEDYEFISRLVNTKEWIEFIGDRNVHSKEEALIYIDKILHSDNLYYWVVRNKSNITMGIVTFLKRHYLDHFDIGFAFLPEFTGRGYACEAAQAILSMVSRNPDYKTTLAITVPDNVRSIRLLIKLGFHFEKELEADAKKIHVYSNFIMA